VNDRLFVFDWDEEKAAKNLRKHGIDFELAATIFRDPNLFTVADLDHGDSEERWFSVGTAENGSILSVFYLWSETTWVTEVRLISARRPSHVELSYYQGSKWTN
jgi:uncharacterized DUF497 family protein